MSEEESKPQDRGQMTENKKQKPRVSKLAKASLICLGLSLLMVVSLLQAAHLGITAVGAFGLAIYLHLGALGCGIAALCKIRLSRGRLTGKRYAVFSIVVTCLVVLGVYFVGPHLAWKTARPSCGTNLSRLGQAILLYAYENHEELPGPEKWCDLLIRYAEAVPKQFICPGSDAEYGESSYAMNISLAGKTLGEVSSDTVLMFETDSGKDSDGRKDVLASREFFEFLDLPVKKGKQRVYANRWNQQGGPELLTLENHQGRGCNVLFADGHVEFVKAEDIGKLKWEAEGAMKQLKVGDDAPGFSLLDQDGKQVKLADFAGTKVLLYFYPKAGTPGCTAQACSVRDSAQALKDLGVAALGVSPDDPNAQKKFDQEHNLGFTLLSDPDHKVADAYGVWGEKLRDGKKSMGIIRSSFLIDEQGKIIGAWYDVSPADTVPKAMEALGEMNNE